MAIKPSVSRESRLEEDITTPEIVEEATDHRPKKRLHDPEKKFLEICVRKDGPFHHLRELDVSAYGGQRRTDGRVFNDIKTQYKAVRSSLGIWNLRFLFKPCAGLFVKVCASHLTKKILTMVRQFRLESQPYAIVVKRDCIPPAKAVHTGEYEYVPVPMDEPPMPSNVFMHYFITPAKAHSQAIWSPRFPHKLERPVRLSNQPLAEGWGIEIEEGLNWVVVDSLMLVALFISAIVAGFYGHFMNDVATGVAIGAWLTAVQTLSAAIVFFKWK